MNAIQKHETVSINDIQHGDVVLIHSGWTTISGKDIKRCPILGTTIQGKNFRNNNFLVKRALFPKWFKREVISWVTQL